MSLFDIREIGLEVEATAGVLDGCELCGQCLVLRRSFSSRAASRCHAAGRATPWDAFFEHETADFSAPAEEPKR